jgi:hypothetical protein
MIQIVAVASKHLLPVVPPREHAALEKAEDDVRGVKQFIKVVFDLNYRIVDAPAFGLDRSARRKSRYAPSPPCARRRQA